jgi:hypothetical protein
MLLRSITKHVKDQNWFAVFLDFFIVVAGILIAFQITNSNEQRADRSVERYYLSTLENDAKTSIENLRDVVALLKKQQDAREQLFIYNTAPEAELQSNEIDALLQGGIFSIQSMKITEISYTDLANSGQISVISDPSLIAALQKLEVAIDTAQAKQEESIQFTFNHTDPYLINETDMQNLIASDLFEQELDEASDFVSKLPRRSQPGIALEKLKSTKFKNLVLLKAEICRGRIVIIEKLIAEYETVLARIEDRKIELGVK